MASEVTQFPLLKDYVIDKRLGTGTYAVVYKAHSKVNTDMVILIVGCFKNSSNILLFFCSAKVGNQLNAIKCIKKSSLNKSSTENLLREIKILKQIKHDYIVDLVDFQVDFIFGCDIIYN